MTGPEHYRIAQDLIAESGDEDISLSTAQIYLAAAQVHATLALVAATVDPEIKQATSVSHALLWAEVTR